MICTMPLLNVSNQLQRILLLMMLLSVTLLIEAQVTIGSYEAPDSEALLDLKETENGSSQKGLLMPRVALNSTKLSNPLGKHVKGMIVYNTATKGDVTPGLYFNDGNQWIRATSASETPPPSGTWFKQGTNTLSASNSDAIWHQNKVAVGTMNIPSSESTATLFVDGDMAVSGKYYTSSSVYADYVFDYYLEGRSDLNKDYRFRTLNEVKDYIYKNKHLPGVTSIKELNKQNNNYTIDMTSLIIQQLEKIEELYIHLIELGDELEEGKKENQRLNKELFIMKTKLAKLSQK